MQLKSWLNQLSLSYDQHKKLKKERKRNKKNDELIKSGHGRKIREVNRRRRGRLRWEGFVEKVSFESVVEERSNVAQ